MFDVCIYHKNCADGVTAAAIVYGKLPDITYLPMDYNDAPPLDAVMGKKVLIVDFSFKQDVMRRIAGVAERVMVLDHHKTAKEELEPLFVEGIIEGIFDMERSGAKLAWDFFHPGQTCPPLVLHVQDRDLWKFEIPGTKAVSAFMFMQPYDLRTWHDLMYSSTQPMIEGGQLLLKKQAKDIAELREATGRTMWLETGDDTVTEVPVFNVPYIMASDLCSGVLDEGKEPVVATYMDTAAGRRFSIRSRGDHDVSEIAKRYGGGGHKNAAGFTRPLGWEGEMVGDESAEPEQAAA